MNCADIQIEIINEQNAEGVRRIRRDDVSEAFVDTVDTILELTCYGAEHGCIGHTFAVKYGAEYVGIILLGEAIAWETDPPEMKTTPFYRLMGFLIDSRYRGMGIGSYVLEAVIERCYAEFGMRPIALGVHRDNHGADAFYRRHGFVKTDAMEGNDCYYLRYPE